MLYHDLSVLNTTAAPADLGRFSPGRKFRERQSWAYVEWKRSLLDPNPSRVHWPLPRWESFWEFDLFLNAWNDIVSRVPPAGVRQPELGLIDRLAFCWMSAATAIVGGHYPLVLSDVGKLPSRLDTEDWWFEPVPKSDWKPLLTRIGTMAKENTRETPRGQRIRNWVTRIALFTFPDTGLSPPTRDYLWKLALQPTVAAKAKDAP